MIDPKLRQRTTSPNPRPRIGANLSNEELLISFEKSVGPTLAPATLKGYAASIRDAIRYFRTAENQEIPVRAWTKTDLSSYIDFVQSNYCANFRQIPFRLPPAAKCDVDVWAGMLPAEEAVRAHCVSCSRFKQPMVAHRLNALGKWFRYLARVGAIPVNVMVDAISDFYDEKSHRQQETGERRRNPSPDEMRRLVNGTSHPQRRAFYAASAKWWLRPNEMFLLDRYASFGLPMPMGLSLPKGFASGFLAHPTLASFDQGGDMAYLPKSKGKTDKRKGNRWIVIDSELRPILMQHLAWWDSKVKRDPNGCPVTTKLWLNTRGGALQQNDLYTEAGFFYTDCERLGLMQPGDRQDSLRRWTAHCQRHFGEQVRQMANVPSDWSNHFRGDAFKDARGKYYEPPPEHVRKKYHELIPRIGFQPLPTGPSATIVTEAQSHRNILSREADHLRLRRTASSYRCVTITTAAGEEWIVPHRILPSILYALRAGRPRNATAPARTDPYTSRIHPATLLAVIRKALVILDSLPPSTS